MEYNISSACGMYKYVLMYVYAYLKMNKKSNETNIWHKIDQIIYVDGEIF